VPLLLEEEAEVLIEHHRRRIAGESMVATHRVMGRYADSAKVFLVAVGWTRDIAEFYAYAEAREIETIGPVIGEDASGNPVYGQPRRIEVMWREEWVPGKGWVESMAEDCRRRSNLCDAVFSLSQVINDKPGFIVSIANAGIRVQVTEDADERDIQQMRQLARKGWENWPVRIG
jgi:hypothetical protein